MQRHKLRRGYRDNRTAFGVPGETGNSVRALLKLSGLIDAINVQIGRWFAWAILLAVAVSAINAVVRKTFDMSSNAWLELQWVLFSVVFLLCASWTLRDNEHIRIDIVNNMLPRALRNAIDIVGHTFFLLRLLRHQRAVHQCRRPAAMAGESADSARLCAAACAGRF